MPQVDTNKLKQAEAASAIVKDMITSAIEQSAANPTLCGEALKTAANEISQIQTIIFDVQRSFNHNLNKNVSSY